MLRKYSKFTVQKEKHLKLLYRSNFKSNKINFIKNNNAGNSSNLYTHIFNKSRNKHKKLKFFISFLLLILIILILLGLFLDYKIKKEIDIKIGNLQSIVDNHMISLKPNILYKKK